LVVPDVNGAAIMVKKTDTIFIAPDGVEILLYQSRNFGMAQGDWTQQDNACEEKSLL
jgi:hypothetical protein